jgi:hypothetical protein
MIRGRMSRFCAFKRGNRRRFAAGRRSAAAFRITYTRSKLAVGQLLSRSHRFPLRLVVSAPELMRTQQRLPFGTFAPGRRDNSSSMPVVRWACSGQHVRSGAAIIAASIFIVVCPTACAFSSSAAPTPPPVAKAMLLVVEPTGEQWTATDAGVPICGRIQPEGPGGWTFSVQLNFPAARPRYLLSMSLVRYTGAGTYHAAGDDNLQVFLGPPSSKIVPAKSHEATLTVDAGERTGSIIAAFPNGPQVSGAWSCPPPGPAR